MPTYLVGELVRVSVTFVTAGAPTDPTTVTFKHKTPAGVTTTKVFNTDVEVVKDSTGQYHRDLNLTESGTWSFRWESTGTAQGAAQDTFSATAASP